MTIGDRNGNRVPDPEEVGIRPLKGDGDFRSEECIELLKQVDIVVTNPPFSLFREYVAQLVKYEVFDYRQSECDKLQRDISAIQPFDGQTLDRWRQEVAFA